MLKNLFWFGRSFKFSGGNCFCVLLKVWTCKVHCGSNVSLPCTCTFVCLCVRQFHLCQIYILWFLYYKPFFSQSYIFYFEFFSTCWYLNAPFQANFILQPIGSTCANVLIHNWNFVPPIALFDIVRRNSYWRDFRIEQPQLFLEFPVRWRCGQRERCSRFFGSWSPLEEVKDTFESNIFSEFTQKGKFRLRCKFTLNSFILNSGKFKLYSPVNSNSDYFNFVFWAIFRLFTF